MTIFVFMEKLKSAIPIDAALRKRLFAEIRYPLPWVEGLIRDALNSSGSLMASRRLLGLSQEEFASLIKASRAAIVKWEGGGAPSQVEYLLGQFRELVFERKPPVGFLFDAPRMADPMSHYLEEFKMTEEAFIKKLGIAESTFNRWKSKGCPQYIHRLMELILHLTLT